MSKPVQRIRVVGHPLDRGPQKLDDLGSFCGRTGAEHVRSLNAKEKRRKKEGKKNGRDIGNSACTRC